MLYLRSSLCLSDKFYDLGQNAASAYLVKNWNHKIFDLINRRSILNVKYRKIFHALIVSSNPKIAEFFFSAMIMRKFLLWKMTSIPKKRSVWKISDFTTDLNYNVKTSSIKFDTSRLKILVIISYERIYFK